MNVDYELEKIKIQREEDAERFADQRTKIYNKYQRSFALCVLFVLGIQLLLAIIIPGWWGVLAVLVPAVGLNVLSRRVSTWTNKEISAIREEEFQMEQAARKAYIKMFARKTILEDLKK
jgi:hypothetical protein